MEWSGLVWEAGMRGLALIVLLLGLPAVAQTWEARGRRSASRDRGPGSLAVAPTLGLSGGTIVLRGSEVLDDAESPSVLGAWLGAAFHPRPATVSPFFSVGTEISMVRLREASLTAVDVVPQVRGGLALLDKPAWEFFPYLQLYVLGGFRISHHVRGSALRLGAGIAIPSFGALQWEIFRGNCLPIIPWMFEVIYDVSEVPEFGFRVGYQF